METGVHIVSKVHMQKREQIYDNSHELREKKGFYTHILCCFSECTRGGFCNFMHLKPISRELRRELYGRTRKKRR